MAGQRLAEVISIQLVAARDECRETDTDGPWAKDLLIYSSQDGGWETKKERIALVGKPSARSIC
jgi:hypothetical protein